MLGIFLNSRTQKVQKTGPAAMPINTRPLAALPPQRFLYAKFPDDFLFGISSSAYQIEGAWNEDGKGETVLDRHSRENGQEKTGTGDFACDSYHNLEKDIEILKKLGVHFYRFSISWARLFPEGKVAKNGAVVAPLPGGLCYYNRLINALRNAGIEPFVTLYHYDLPQKLQDEGGWLKDTTVDQFVAYSRFCFQHFGDRVKYWLTIHDPFGVCVEGHELGTLGPGIRSSGTHAYTVGHNLIKAHARVYHVYDNVFRQSQGGFVSLSIKAAWYMPKSGCPEDVAASDRMLQFHLGWFCNPIFVSGDYPVAMRVAVDTRCQDAGLPESRLPTFTEQETDLIRGSADFFSLCYYTTYMVEGNANNNGTGFQADAGVNVSICKEWPPTAKEENRVMPTGLRCLLNHIKHNFNKPAIFVMETGYSAKEGELLSDKLRIDFIRASSQQALKGILDDRINIKGFAVWSLLDSCEFRYGNSARFGLYQVNFNDPNRPRKAKTSAGFYARLISDNGYVRITV